MRFRDTRIDIAVGAIKCGVLYLSRLGWRVMDPTPLWCGGNVPTAEQLEVLESQSLSVLAAWWCMLNKFKWSRELPESCDGMTVMFWISNRIGYKECLRAWNDEHMSRDEFEDWWRNRLL